MADTLTSRRIQGYGWRPQMPDSRDYVLGIDRRPAQLPTRMSLRPQMPPVYDQGQLGSCTGNAIAAAMEHAEILEGEGSITPSRLFIYYGERVIEGTVSQDAGAEIRDGLKVVATLGAPAETDWPYDIARFAHKPPKQAYTDALKRKAIEYFRVLPGSGAPIRHALAAGHPIVFGFSVPSYFEDPSWNPATQALAVPGANANFIGGHAVLAIGYDWTLSRFPVPVIEVRNSWGADWGDAGHFFMAAGWFDGRLSSDYWCVRKTS